jgi:hypothetical protein
MGYARFVANIKDNGMAYFAPAGFLKDFCFFRAWKRNLFVLGLCAAPSALSSKQHKKPSHNKTGTARCFKTCNAGRLLNVK